MSELDDLLILTGQVRVLREENDRLRAENQRLREYAHLVETAVEAEECNGEQGDRGTIITLHSSWFERAKALLAEADAALRQEE